MFILKKGHQPGVYVPLRALFLVYYCLFMVVQQYLLAFTKNTVLQWESLIILSQ